MGSFPLSDQQAIRTRKRMPSASLFRNGCCRVDGKGRVAALEILKPSFQPGVCRKTKEKLLLDAMRDGSQDGMQYFDGEIERPLSAPES